MSPFLPYRRFHNVLQKFLIPFLAFFNFNFYSLANIGRDKTDKNAVTVHTNKLIKCTQGIPYRAYYHGKRQNTQKSGSVSMNFRKFQTYCLFLAKIRNLAHFSKAFISYLLTISLDVFRKGRDDLSLNFLRIHICWSLRLRKQSSRGFGCCEALRHMLVRENFVVCRLNGYPHTSRMGLAL